MRRPKLDAARAEIRARMEAGETMDWRKVWRSVDDASRCWAHETLKLLHAAGEIHIAQYSRGESGPAMPVYRWGPGKDAERPKPLTDAQKCARWRKKHPDKVERANKRTTYLKRKTPMLDPLMAAVLGYYRRGSGWVKRKGEHDART